jgi:ABC-type dipeptide/oligopeptide/nickel transport system permease subunit
LNGRFGQEDERFDRIVVVMMRMPVIMIVIMIVTVIAIMVMIVVLVLGAPVASRIRMLGGEELGIDVEYGVQVEPAHIEHLGNRGSVPCAPA